MYITVDIYKFIHSFIHSGYFYGASSSPLLLRGAPDTAGILCCAPQFHREVPQATVSEGLAQGRYVADICMYIYIYIPGLLFSISLCMCLWVCPCVSVSLKADIWRGSGLVAFRLTETHGHTIDTYT